MNCDGFYDYNNYNNYNNKILCAPILRLNVQATGGWALRKFSTWKATIFSILSPVYFYIPTQGVFLLFCDDCAKYDDDDDDNDDCCNVDDEEDDLQAKLRLDGQHCPLTIC